MLLTRIELLNFLAYQRPRPIDLEGLGLACLSGPNGAGKSSLLDAVTWALWGRARAKTSDDELIYAGQQEMRVVVDFLQDGRRYRVERQRKRGKNAGLRLLGYEEGWNILNDGVRDAQQQINKLLHLDFETFINSAFLQQGKADSFTLKTSKERKDILTEILGLERWGEYEKRAKARLAKLKEQLEQIETSIRHYDLEIAREPEYRAKLEHTTQRAHELGAERAEREAAFEQVKGAGRNRDDAELQLREARRRHDNQMGILQTLTRSLERKQEQFDHAAEIIGRRDEIEQGYTVYQAAQAQSTALQKREREFNKLEKQVGILEGQIAREETKLQAEAERLRRDIRKAEEIAAKLTSVQESLTEREQTVMGLIGEREEREALQTRREVLQTESARLNQHNEQLEQATEELRDKYSRLNKSTANCPLCGQPLDDDHRAQLLQESAEAGQANKRQVTENKAALAEMKRELSEIEQRMRAIDRDLKNLDALQAEFVRLQGKLAEAHEAASNAERDRAALGHLENQLQHGDFAHDQRAELAQVREALHALGYDPAAQEVNDAQLLQFQEFDNARRELAQAEKQLPLLEEELAELFQQQENCRAEIAREAETLPLLEERLNEFKVLAKEEDARREAVKEARIRESEAIKEKGAAEQALDAVEGARRRKREFQDKRETVQREFRTCDQLVKAFGQNGVPAMIIEAAIPKLEVETNRILSLISDGQMHVQFTSQRENKSGTVADRLDILISDDLGTRDYSMYSGGEGFRVNFAVRVALSQFLANRAGSGLKTLFIDEGFGSQDALGRERLIDAINRISGEFDLILVVTHIDELRDAFQKHLRVSKGRNGSEIALQYN
jgi:exonuclease SbcC